MIISVWEGQLSEEDMGVEVSEVPHTQYRRLLVKAPTLESLPKIHEALDQAGVPPNATLEFERWNVPADSWYVHAVWVDNGG